MKVMKIKTAGKGQLTRERPTTRERPMTRERPRTTGKTVWLRLLSTGASVCGLNGLAIHQA